MKPEQTGAALSAYSVVDLLVKAATPFVTAIFGFRILSASKKLEQKKSHSDKLLDHRFALLKELFGMCGKVRAFHRRPMSSMAPDPREMLEIHSSLRDWHAIAEPFVSKEILDCVDRFMDASYLSDVQGVRLRASAPECEGAFNASGRAWNQDWDNLLTPDLPPAGQLKSVSNDLSVLARGTLGS